MTKSDKILIIKLGALGDFIQALGPIRSIRQYHPKAQITLLTTPPFEKFAQQSGYVDQVWLDEKPSWLDGAAWIRLYTRLNAEHFTRVYDLQNNDRSNLYFKLLRAPKPEWIGTAKGASHQNASPERTKYHAFDGHIQTLALAGITNITTDRLEWLQTNITHFHLQNPYVLLVPGCAPSHPYKRWPAHLYAECANQLAQMGVQPVLIGTQDDQDATSLIAHSCTAALDLTGLTSLAHIATLAHHAAAAIGNDTGPMHLIAATGCPSLSLFSNRTNPVKHAPKGDSVTVLQSKDLSNLPVNDVMNALQIRHNVSSDTIMLH